MGTQNLRLEVFESDRAVKEKEFHVYAVKTFDMEDNPIKIIRTACRKLSNCNYNNGIFENGEDHVGESD